MSTNKPAIIEVAVNGSTSKEVNCHVPRTPSEVTEDLLACLDAGASILHTHTDDPNFGGTGRHDPQPYIQAWGPVLERRPDAVLYPTMEGGGQHTTIGVRTEHLQVLADRGMLRTAIVDMGTTNMGSVNDDGTPTASDALFINTNADAHYMFDFCRRENLGPSIGIIEPGSIRVMLAFWSAGRLPRGAMVRLMFGGPKVLCSLPPSKAALEVYLSMFEHTGLPWSVATPGLDPWADGFAQYALDRGGHIRIGLEDHATHGQSNAELVAQAVELLAQSGRRAATPQEVIEILDLPERVGAPR